MILSINIKRGRKLSTIKREYIICLTWIWIDILHRIVIMYYDLAGVG